MGKLKAFGPGYSAACALRNLDHNALRVARWTPTFLIRLSHWLISKTSLAKSVDYLRVRKSIFCYQGPLRRVTSFTNRLRGPNNQLCEFAGFHVACVAGVRKGRGMNTRSRAPKFPLLLLMSVTQASFHAAKMNSIIYEPVSNFRLNRFMAFSAKQVLKISFSYLRFSWSGDAT